MYNLNTEVSIHLQNERIEEALEIMEVCVLDPQYVRFFGPQLLVDLAYAYV